MDLQVITNNFTFLIVQGFLGIGGFVGGTLRLAVPAIVLGFVLGIFIGLGRLARSRWINYPATIYVEFFRGVPLVMVIFWFWFIIPVLIVVNVPAQIIARPVDPQGNTVWPLAIFALFATAGSLAVSRWVFLASLRSYRSASS